MTTSWAMIHHLDNSESAGPKSVTASQEWRRRKKRPATINENHARELLELHTVSPKAGYTQEDVIQLAYIMTGWQQRWSKSKLETGNVWFNSEYHQQGKKNVLAICPGFSSDCVETLEEIQIQGKESFLESGGENFDMVPCLNDNDDHIILLKSLVQKNI